MAAAAWCCVLGLLGSQCGLEAVTFPLSWRWSNPSPHGGNVVDMAYHPNLYLAVQVAERGQIYTSDNLDLWLPRNSHVTDGLRAVSFFGTRIVITGENGRVLYADDVNDIRAGSLADGPTTDWLEAVAASASLAVAVGDNAAIYTSTNGMIWKKQGTPFTDWLRGVAYGGGTFIAVGEAGTVASSRNGTNWSKISVGTSQDLNRVTFAGNRFSIVGDAGFAVSSTNGGVNWYADATGATNTLQNAVAALNPGGGTYDRLALGDHEVRLNDGTGWSNELAKSNAPPAWTYYGGIGRPDFFYIAGQSGMQSEGYQTNGNPHFWLTPYDSVRNWLWDVTYASNVYVAVGDFGTVMTSGSGAGWTLELVPLAMTNTTLLGVGGTTNLLVAVGDSGGLMVSPNYLTNAIKTNLSGIVYTQTVSTLGVVWHAILPRPTTNDLQGVAALSNSLYVVTGERGSVLTSPDGTNWTRQTAPTTNFLSGVTEWPGGLVAVGDDGVILTSPNGVSWASEKSNTTNWLYRVRHLNGTLIAVGQNGVILTSSTGTGWTARVSGTTKWLSDVTFVDGVWIVVGTGGTVLSSSNLVTWTSRGTLTKKALYGAATDSRQLVVVGVEGCILRSQVVPDLTPITILAYSRMQATNGPTMTQNLFLFGGHTDQRFTLDRASSVMPIQWATGSPLEIFDVSGTLYYLETFLGTNQLPAEYYRAPLVP